jgi:hypothetical protein
MRRSERSSMSARHGGTPRPITSNGPTCPPACHPRRTPRRKYGVDILEEPISFDERRNVVVQPASLKRPFVEDQAGFGQRFTRLEDRHLSCNAPRRARRRCGARAHVVAIHLQPFRDLIIIQGEPHVGEDREYFARRLTRTRSVAGKLVLPRRTDIRYRRCAARSPSRISSVISMTSTVELHGRTRAHAPRPVPLRS